MKRLFLITLVLGVFITSCQNDSKSLSDYDITETGLYYRFYNCNEGITPQFMELMDVQLSCCVNDTSVILPLNRTILQLTEPLFAGDIFGKIDNILMMIIWIVWIVAIVLGDFLGGSGLFKAGFSWEWLYGFAAHLIVLGAMLNLND